MTQDGGEYDIRPPEPPPGKPKPGDPDWVEPVPIIEKADPEPESAPEEPPPDPDVEKHKGVAILGYFFFVFPLLLAPQSKFARYHANQGLLVFIVWCAAIITTVIIQVIWSLLGESSGPMAMLLALLGCLLHVLPLALVVTPLVLMVMGIIHAANGEKRPLPLVGHWTLLK